MGNYSVRKISDLPPAESLYSGDLLYVAKLDSEAGSFTSNKADFGVIRESIVSAAVERARQTFDIPEGMQVLNGLSAALSAISEGESTISAATFIETPVVSDSQPDLSAISDNALVTKKTAVSIVDADKSYIGPDSTISCTPANDGGYTRYSPNLLEWHFNHGGRDSSEYIPQSGAAKVAGYVTCPATGQLVIYGWLADNGGVLPEECWVAVFGKILCMNEADGSYSEKPVALAVQPWVIGANSQVAQYVGFQLPVKAGMQLKIMTGFNVNGRNSGFGRAHSLMLNDPDAGGNMPNTFVGYIVEH